MSDQKILIVEDEEIVALDLEQRLARIGYTVMGTTASGNEAIRLASELNPHVILMDIKLSGDMDGIETAGRQHGKTARSEEGTVQLGLFVGFQIGTLGNQPGTVMRGNLVTTRTTPSCMVT